MENNSPNKKMFINGTNKSKVKVITDELGERGKEDK